MLGFEYLCSQKKQDRLLNLLGSMDLVQKLQLLFLGKNKVFKILLGDGAIFLFF